jgi:hypothetical protein
MRNTTKLKLVLQLYSITIDLEENAHWILLLRDKISGAIHTVEGDSWSVVVEKAYRMMKRKLKEGEGEIMPDEV